MKEKTTLEFKIEERIYQFVCDEDSPLGQVFDALTAMRNYVANQIQKEVEKQTEQVMLG